MINDPIKKKGKEGDMDEGDKALSDDANPGEDEVEEEEELDTDWTEDEKEQ